MTDDPPLDLAIVTTAANEFEASAIAARLEAAGFECHVAGSGRPEVPGLAGLGSDRCAVLVALADLDAAQAVLETDDPVPLETDEPAAGHRVPWPARIAFIATVFIALLAAAVMVLALVL